MNPARKNFETQRPATELPQRVLKCSCATIGAILPCDSLVPSSLPTSIFCLYYDYQDNLGFDTVEQFVEAAICCATAALPADDEYNTRILEYAPTADLCCGAFIYNDIIYRIYPLINSSAFSLTVSIDLPAFLTTDKT